MSTDNAAMCEPRRAAGLRGGRLAMPEMRLPFRPGPGEEVAPLDDFRQRIAAGDRIGI